MKYLKKFSTKASAIAAQDLVSPNATYIEELDKRLNLSCGLDKELEIVEEGSDVIIREKATGPEYVDLGLSVKWAKCNIGATSETDYGKYFQFGDVVGYTGDDAKAHSTWSTCPCNGGSSSYDSTYFNAHKSELLDSNNILLPSCDAAHVAYGGNWRLPKTSEIKELANTFFTWNDDEGYYEYKSGFSEWVENYNGSGINGTLIHGQGEYSGNTLFIPASGGVYLGSFHEVGDDFSLWSSSLNSDDPECAYGFYADSDYAYVSSSDRCVGLALRGVC